MGEIKLANPRLSPIVPPARHRSLDAGEGLSARAESLARESPRGAAVAFQHSQAGLLARNIIASHRNDALLFGQLHLEHHHILLAERHLRRGEIELPHPHEALVIEPLDLLAMREKTFAPGLERVGVMQT